MIQNRHSQSIVLSLDLAADDREARPAVVVPVPALPRVSAVEDGDPLAYLEQATTTTPSSQSSGGGEAASGGVEVIGRERIAGYDVARLGSADATALRAWLDKHGYELPAAAEPILSDYADEDWRFVAIRLAPGSEGTLKPLKISFDSEETVYPMRLSQLATEPVSLTLFVLARAERRVKGFDRTWSGKVSELRPPPPPQLRDLLSADDHLTRIEAQGVDPGRFTRDLVIEALPAPPGASGPDEGGLSTLGFVLIAAGGLVVLAGAFVVKVRRDGRLLQQP